ncbi:CBS domain-containing protein [Azospirillum sp.]|uniref:CBS domain-containing protein n=1 Tax=Azospirillum sp. TaxID=34012 RepID=UPI002D531A7C|nr:CBS domain-containing protein [Azospirillum sp.]HYD65072.1 CBS domain-containing protein [Azospirillum sp.]
MHVAAVLKRKGTDIVTVRPDEPIAAVARTLAERRIGAALVVDGGAPAGILSERDIVRGVAKHGSAVLQQPASALMTRDLVTCQPTDTVAQVMAVMSERRIRHLPVMDGERLAGVISIGDVVKARLDDAELEVESLRGYVAGIG